MNIVLKALSRLKEKIVIPHSKKMESSPKKFGDYGETLAVNFLKKHGYTIIQRNYKCIYGEIDIIAKENNCIVFIEVKTRKTGGEILPEDSINYAKERRLTKA